MTIQSTNALTPARMRRLAAAIDGEAPGEQRWVVMSEADPYIVAGVFPTLRRAQDALGRVTASRPFGVFGPFANAPGTPPLMGVTGPGTPLPPGCAHFGLSEIFCYPPPSQFGALRDIRDQIAVTDPLTGTTFPGSQIDAIFFDRSAFATFVHPHLIAVHGLGGTISYLSARGSGHY